MEVIEMSCITCPNGCRLKVQKQAGSYKVEGNGCNRGDEFAKAELTNPMRSLTTTVRTTIPGVPVLPVRTDGEIPKDKIMEAMKALSDVVVSSELGCGDTVLEDIVESGVRVIATSDLIKREVSKPAGSDDLNEMFAQDDADESTDGEEEQPEEDDTEQSDSSWRLQGRSHIRR